jgi:hypothetical protein
MFLCKPTKKRHLEKPGCVGEGNIEVGLEDGTACSGFIGLK